MEKYRFDLQLFAEEPPAQAQPEGTEPPEGQEPAQEQGAGELNEIGRASCRERV